MRRAVAAAWLAAFALALPTPLPAAIYFDLAAAFPLAEVRREPSRIDLRSREAALFLRRGFSSVEEKADDLYVWSDGSESELVFFLAEARQIELAWSCLPFSYPGAPPQTVSVAVNGKQVGRVTLAEGTADYKLTLPADVLRSGDNRLVLRYAWTRSPAEVDGASAADRRQLAVAWRGFELGTGADAGSRVRAAGGQLALPRGVDVGFFLVLAPQSALTLAGLSAPRGGDPRLEVLVRGEGEEPRRLALLEPGAKPVRVAFPEAGRRPVRLSLRALGGDLVLKKPAIDGFVPTRPAASPAAAVGGPRHNVIVYLIDTLRADHLGCYGYPLPTSPHIDRFAAQATRFANAVAQSPWTRPSTASLLTGLRPKTHAVNGRRDALAPEALTLAEMLAGQGYRTAAFVTNGNIARSLGFGQGFESYKLLPGRANRALDVTTEALAWLDGRERGSPFFLYLHTVEPHSPYDPPALFRERFAPGVAGEVGQRRWLKRLEQGREIPVTPRVLADLQALYDAEIAANDAAFGELVAGLTQRGLWEETVIVLLSDHGEEFFEHGRWEHGNQLYREVLDIPLIVRLPGLGAGRTVARQAQQIDVVPTLLSHLGLPVPAAVEGRSLLPLVAGEAAAELGDDVACSWMQVDGYVGGAVSVPEWRFVELAAPAASRQLFDRSDLAEKTDLARQRPVAAGFLRSALAACAQPRSGRLTEREGSIDDEVREQLRALGYID